VLTDLALCGPVTLALPQDVQTMAYDFPADFFAPPLVLFRAPAPADAEIEAAARVLRAATTTHHRGWRRPLRGCFGAVCVLSRSARNRRL